MMDPGRPSKRKRASETQGQIGGQKRMEQNTGLDAKLSTMHLQMALPVILSWFKLTEILLCRQVSKTWRFIADSVLEKYLTDEPYNDDLHLRKLRRSPNDILPLPKFRSIQYAYIFKDEAVLQRFNETMATHVESGSSPFVGGATVTLKCFLSSFSTMNPTTRKFLELFGLHIKRLKIRQSGNYFDVQIPLYMEAVKFCIQNTPNLKTLVVDGKRLGCVSESSKEFDHSANNASIEREVYRHEVLLRSPYLCNLESLALRFEDIFCKFPYLLELFSTIMIKPNYLRQLKQLTLIWDKSFELPSDMSNLHDLKLTINELDLETNLPEKWIEGAPVEKLYLDFQIHPPFSNMAVLGNIIQTFPLLKYLKLREIPKADLGKSFKLAASNVHTLELTHVTRLDGVKYEFLAAFSNMRCLVMSEDNRHSLWDNSMLKKLVDKMVPSKELIIPRLVSSGTFYDTMLWNILPNLEFVKFQYQRHRNPARMMRCANDPYITCKCKPGSKNECKFISITGSRVGF